MWGWVGGEKQGQTDLTNRMIYTMFKRFSTSGELHQGKAKRGEGWRGERNRD